METFGSKATMFSVGLRVYVCIVGMLSCSGCDDKQFNPGADTHHFEFRTVIPVVSEFRTYQVVFGRANNGYTVFTACFFRWQYV